MTLVLLLFFATRSTQMVYTNLNAANQEAADAILGDDFALLQSMNQVIELQKANLLKESSDNGGPDSFTGAMYTMMDLCKLTTKSLAKKLNISRSKMVKMLEGRTPIPPAVHDQISTIFRQIRPDLY